MSVNGQSVVCSKLYLETSTSTKSGARLLFFQSDRFHCFLLKDDIMGT